MKKTGSIFLALTLLCICASAIQLRAQSPAVSLPDTAVAPGTSFSIPVTVVDFEDITGVQFIISWDSTILRYKGITNKDLPISLGENFGTSAVTGGTLRFLWFENSLQPLTLKDSAALFAIDFEWIGPSASTSTSLEFTEDELTKIEIYDANFTKIEAATFTNGSLSTLQTSGINNRVQPSWMQVASAAPNPFSASTTIEIALQKAITADLSIFDLSGKLIYQQAYRLGTGTHRITLGDHIFPSPGPYVYRMRSADYAYSQLLIFN